MAATMPIGRGTAAARPSPTSSASLKPEDLQSQTSQRTSESPGSATESTALQGLEAKSIVNVQGWLVDAMINDDLRVLLGGDPKTVKSVFEKLMAIGNAHVRDSLEVQRRVHHPAEGQLRDLRFEVQRSRENNARGGALVDELRVEIGRGQTRERNPERANGQWQAELTGSQAKIELLTKGMFWMFVQSIHLKKLGMAQCQTDPTTFYKYKCENLSKNESSSADGTEAEGRKVTGYIFVLAFVDDARCFGTGDLVEECETEVQKHCK
jgi:hypothetical protein